MKKTLDLSIEDWLILKMELGARSVVLDEAAATDKAEALRRVLLEIARSGRVFQRPQAAARSAGGCGKPAQAGALYIPGVCKYQNGLENLAMTQ